MGDNSASHAEERRVHYRSGMTGDCLFTCRGYASADTHSEKQSIVVLVDAQLVLPVTDLETVEHGAGAWLRVETIFDTYRDAYVG